MAHVALEHAPEPWLPSPALAMQKAMLVASAARAQAAIGDFTYGHHLGVA